MLHDDGGGSSSFMWVDELIRLFSSSGPRESVTKKMMYRSVTTATLSDVPQIPK